MCLSQPLSSIVKPKGPPPFGLLGGGSVTGGWQRARVGSGAPALEVAQDATLTDKTAGDGELHRPSTEEMRRQRDRERIVVGGGRRGSRVAREYTVLAYLGRTADAAGQQRNNAIVPSSHETAGLVWCGT